MAIRQDQYSNTDYISSQVGTEVSGGVLQLKNINNQAVLSFDGVNDRIEVADSSTLSFGNASADSPFSICAWIYMRDATAFRILDKTFDANNREYFFTVDGNDKLRLLLYDLTPANTEQVISDIAFTSFENTWIHVACSYDGGGGSTASAGMKLYLNGVQLTTTTFDAGTYVAMHNLAIVSNIGYVGIDASTSNGMLADVSVYGAVLTQGEIVSLMQKNTLPTDYGSAISWWKLDEDTGTSAADSVGSNTGTISGATWTDASLYVPTGYTNQTNKLGAGKIKEIQNFKYTTTQKNGGSRHVHQFSTDNTNWKNSANKDVTNSGCYSFDGVDDRISKTIANYRSGDSSGSITARVLVNAVVTNNNILSSSDIGTATSYFSFSTQASTNRLRFTTRNAAGTVNEIVSVNPVPMNQWSRVAVTSSGTAWKLYIDGVEQAITVLNGSNTGDWFADVTLRDNVTIGANITTSVGAVMEGLIDDVSVYTDTLTQAQIISINQGLTLPTDYNVVNRWKLDGNGNDSVGSDNLTVTGATSVTELWRLHHQGDAVEDMNALYFDGSGDYITVANDVRTALNGASGITFGGWFNFSSTADAQSLFVTRIHTGLAGFTFDLSTANTIRVAGRSQSADSFQSLTEAFKDSGRSVFLVGVLDFVNNLMHIYKDGVLLKSGSATFGASSYTLDTPDGTNILFANIALGAPFTGTSSNIGLWTDVRTPAEILTDFKNGYIGADANLIVNYPLNEGTGSTADNAEGTAALDGTINGNPQWIKDEYRPIPAAPTQQTIDLTGLTFASGNDLYIRSFTQNESGLYTPKVTEITLEFIKAGGGLLLQRVGS